ncbi:lysophospholipid acyltransferase family protein [Clostridium cylindrosporum]|uniref:1-acyl-sn-glycerol-3-phosphate acyltransferase n=1 Tax=Clostridium cylindrosporum DSM 605 TaxID=1121307 RepID=A0A0J8D807_CLOCY|nr:lysophospholipid acyltransferase family protein [Clostridium cylindrosporum]KMT22185.1 1-acyl-sn-glycerol-3-phosphate acyltransferase [Clostridium cylindrosporum DSM 605]
MFRSILWYSNFALSLVGTIPSMLKVKKYDKNNKTEDDKKKREDFVYDFVTNWAKNRLKSAGATIKVYGEDNIPEGESVLFMSNHQSNFDIPLLLGFINTHKGFVAKLELGQIPILNKWMENIDCVFMDRSSIRKSAEAIAETTKLLKRGRSMVIFPEGTRSCCNTMGEFKAGSFKLATKSKVKIVPITINGSYKLMEANGNKIKPSEVEMYIHTPIETKGLTKEEEDMLPDKVKAIIASKLN